MFVVCWGSMAAIHFLKMLIMMYRCIAFLYGVVKNQHFQSTPLGGREGVIKKSTLYAFDNVDNSGRPIICI